MRLKLIDYVVFKYKECHGVAGNPHRVDIEFAAISLPDNPDSLRQFFQAKIDWWVASRIYDAIFLCFSLYGNSILNLQAYEVPIVIPMTPDDISFGWVNTAWQIIDRFSSKILC
jgi:hypothetical protein